MYFTFWNETKCGNSNSVWTMKMLMKSIYSRSTCKFWKNIFFFFFEIWPMSKSLQENIQLIFNYSSFNQVVVKSFILMFWLIAIKILLPLIKHAAVYNFLAAIKKLIQSMSRIIQINRSQTVPKHPRPTSNIHPTQSGINYC